MARHGAALHGQAWHGMARQGEGRLTNASKSNMPFPQSEPGLVGDYVRYRADHRLRPWALPKKNMSGDEHGDALRHGFTSCPTLVRRPSRDTIQQNTHLPTPIQRGGVHTCADICTKRQKAENDGPRLKKYIWTESGFAGTNMIGQISDVHINANGFAKKELGWATHGIARRSVARRSGAW